MSQFPKPKRSKGSSSAAVKLRREERLSLSDWRNYLKAWVWNNRSSLCSKGKEIFLAPTCPICDKVIEGGGDMHEALITRGQAKGAPEDEYIKIFVPVNVVILHPADCHLKAQHTDEGWELCLRQILKYHTKEDIYNWLGKLNLGIAMEVRKRVEQFERDPSDESVSTHHQLQEGS